LLQALVILGHPRPGSLNHAMADAVREELAGLGGSVCYHDLYAERFDPVLPAQEIPKDAKVPADIRTHCEQLADADLIVVVHPNWWGQPPALLKAQAAIVFNTSNTSPSRELEAFGDPLELLWWNCVFRLCGAKRFRRKTYGVVVTSSAEMRRSWIQDARKIVREEFDRASGPSP
jgi:NAD(P)H dehydrogenase (quinone)